MMIGVAFSRGLVSIRVTPSIGSAVPVWATISSSAGSDINAVLLCSWDMLSGNGFDYRLIEECRKGREFVGGAFDADNRWAIVVERRAKSTGAVAENSCLASAAVISDRKCAPPYRSSMLAPSTLKMW